MKQSLQLRVSQSLTMTPQLQQAIRLLQLSSVELQNEIQEILESNMMLELDEGDEADSLDQPDEMEPVTSEDNTTINTETIPDDLPVDSVWEDIYETTPGNTSGNIEQGFFENQDAGEITLHNHLLWQLNLTTLNDQDAAIATAIIDALDDDGYLSCSLEEIHDSLGDDVEVELSEIEAVLHLVQNMDPPGIGARDLRECLLLQLSQFDPDTVYLEESKELVSRHLELMGSRDYNQILRRMKVDKKALQAMIELIQTLNPKPGTAVQNSKTEYIIPDVYVKKEKGAWRVELNSDAIPPLRINTGYVKMIKRADNSNDNISLKNHLQEARWFIKSLQSRSETLLRVASCIVEKQKPFLEYGEESMKAMVLHDVAEELDLHESTISRVTTRKYMHTPRGIFELKYFFSSHVSTDDGNTFSSTAIRALIKKLIGEESTRKPLSDSKIAKLLSEKGIRVARRTVAKYREAMNIPPSNERKQFV